MAQIIKVKNKTKPYTKTSERKKHLWKPHKQWLAGWLNNVQLKMGDSGDKKR